MERVKETIGTNVQKRDRDAMFREICGELARVTGKTIEFDDQWLDNNYTTYNYRRLASMVPPTFIQRANYFTDFAAVEPKRFCRWLPFLGTYNGRVKVYCGIRVDVSDTASSRRIICGIFDESINATVRGIVRTFAQKYQITNVEFIVDVV